MRKTIINALELWIGTLEYYMLKIAPYAFVSFLTYILTQLSLTLK